MFEDDFLESRYEEINGGSDFYEYDSQDFDERADFDVYEFDDEESDCLDELDLVEL